MLIGQVIDPTRSFRLQRLVDELARTHVSRYPIEVKSNGEQQVLFCDTRTLVTGKERGTIAKLGLHKNEKDNTHKLEIHCDRIINNKYSSHSDGLHSRKTDNDMKMRKMLKEYIYPLTSEEITSRTMDDMTSRLSEWKGESEDALRKLHIKLGISWYNLVDRSVLMLDIMKYLETGTAYSTSTLAAYTSPEYLAIYKENVKRQTTPAPTTHVFINPDGAVYLTHKSSEKYDCQSLNTFEALPENILSQIAMLKLANTDKVVDGVGVQTSDLSFWVYA